MSTRQLIVCDICNDEIGKNRWVFKVNVKKAPQEGITTEHICRRCILKIAAVALREKSAEDEAPMTATDVLEGQARTQEKIEQHACHHDEIRVTMNKDGKIIGSATCAVCNKMLVYRGGVYIAHLPYSLQAAMLFNEFSVGYAPNLNDILEAVKAGNMTVCP